MHASPTHGPPPVYPGLLKTSRCAKVKLSECHGWCCSLMTPPRDLLSGDIGLCHSFLSLAVRKRRGNLIFSPVSLCRCCDLLPMAVRNVLVGVREQSSSSSVTTPMRVFQPPTSATTTASCERHCSLPMIDMTARNGSDVSEVSLADR